MPEEFESPVEKISEELHEMAEEAKEHWIRWCALLSAIFAVAVLISSYYANNAMIEQIQASDQWSYFQAKSIKSIVVESEQNILKQLGKPITDSGKLTQYENEQHGIKEVAEKLTESSKHHLEQHEVLSRTVTLSQVAIAIIAIAVLTRRRAFVLVSIIFGVASCLFFVQGLVLT